MQRIPIHSLTRIHLLGFVLVGLFGSLCFLFLSKPDWIALSVSRDQGFLMSSITPLTRLPLKSADNQPFDTTQLRGKWLILYFNTKNCSDSSCARYLADMSRLQQTLGKDQPRLQRLWMNLATLKNNVPHQPEKTLFVVNTDKTTALVSNRFYIVDPFGNAIVSYKNTTPMRFILNDLQQLMKVSDIG